MTFSATGTIISALILLAFIAGAVTSILTRFSPNSRFSIRLELIESRLKALTESIQRGQALDLLPQVSFIVLFTELFFLIPIAVSGFYLGIPYIGILASIMFNFILAICLIYWRTTNTENAELRLLAMKVDWIMTKLRIQRK